MVSGYILLILIAVSSFRLIDSSEEEERLIHYLFSEQGYNPLIRPTRYANETVIVSFGLLLVQLIHVFEKEQVMKTNTWLHMKWQDFQLRWNPERYGGIKNINIPVTNVWTPDVVLFNNADGNYEVTFKSKVILLHTGEVQWVPPAIYKSSCRIDVKYFPFDTQECEMRFASWTYNAREVLFAQYDEDHDPHSDINKLLPQQAYNPTTGKLYRDDYLESGTWDVVGIPSRFIHYRTNASSTLPDYIEVVFLLKISRKTLFYTVNLIVPAGLMSILICIVFCLPTVAGEKMMLCMSILLALNLFQLLVTKILPPTSAVVPLIAKYLLFTFTLNVLVIVNTVVITNFYYRTPMTHIMPGWMRRFFLQILPPLLWMECPKLQEKPVKFELASIRLTNGFLALENPRPRLHHTTTNGEKNLPKRHETTPSNLNDKRRVPTMLIKLLFDSKHHHHSKVLLTTSDHRHRTELIHMRREFRQALVHIRYIATHCTQKAFIESIRDEWKLTATVIDRLQLVTFSLVAIGGSLALFLQVPHIFQLGNHDPHKLVRFSNPNTTIHELLPTFRT